MWVEAPTEYCSGRYFSALNYYYTRYELSLKYHIRDDKIIVD
jgi:hypothetical protein